MRGWELAQHFAISKLVFLFNICSPYRISPNQNGRYFLFDVCVMSTRINFVLIYVKTIGINFIHMMIQKLSCNEKDMKLSWSWVY